MHGPINGMRAIHPGEILREEFLVPLAMSGNALSQAIRVPANRINGIVAERRAVGADTALRLARYFRTTPQFWLSLQQSYDLQRAKSASRSSLAAIRPMRRGRAA